MKTLLVALMIATCATAADRPVLWKDPGPIESLDLAGGPGGRDKAPQPPFVFEKEELSGTSPKVFVRDGRGAEWVVKFGQEAKPETFASRIAWAAGYVVPATYFVPEGKIDNVGPLGRAGQFIDHSTGAFRDARFEPAYNDSFRIIPGSKWDMRDSSLKNTKELSGLKLTMILVSNWDAKQVNMSIAEVNGQRFYSFTDWGASMGAPGAVAARSKWNCEAFAHISDTLVDGIDDGYVSFIYNGKDADAVANGIRVEDVQWYMNRMGKLTDDQIRAALQASGATPAETTCFTNALRKRLSQLAAIGSGSTVTRTITKTTTTTTQPQQ